MRKVVTDVKRLKSYGELAVFRIHTVPNATIDEIKNDPEIKSLFGNNFDLDFSGMQDVYLLKTDLRVAV